VILPRLYAVLDAGVAAAHGWTVPDLGRAFLDGGARLIQWRAKGVDGSTLFSTCEVLVRLAEPAGARIIVNDRADVARLTGAAGVHVGQDDLSPTDVRALLGADAIVGWSSHSAAQIDLAASEPISYLAVGPVFGTATKDTGYAAVGLDLLRYAAAAERNRWPIVAIGGITLSTAPEALMAGARSVAVISDLMTGGNPVRRVREYVVSLGD
jgi:thiamine-phosphate pyrophosphorylase